MNYRIAIDGPSGAGKSTIARAIAKEFGIVYVDTGAMYRSIGLYVQRKGIAMEDEAAVVSVLPEIKLEIQYIDGEQHILLCGEDVGDSIRTPEISMYASRVSAIPAVRAFLLNTQRDLAKTSSVIMDGRDIGTVIFPDAEVKIFLTASVESRAERRYEELLAKGIATTKEEVLADMQKRDKNDSERAVAPAVAAEDAILLDTSGFPLEKSIAAVKKIITEKLSSFLPAQQDKAAPLPPSAPKKKKKSRFNFYTVLRFLLGGILRFFMRIRVHGKENIPKDGAYVICANHIAIRDIFVLASAFPRQICFLAKKELFRIPVLHGILKICSAVPIDRGGNDVAGLKKLIHLAEDGNLVGIFPQGTRCSGKNPADTPIKSGAGFVASRAKVGMIPVCIKTKGERYGFLRRKDVYIGEPIPYEALFQSGSREEATLATETVFASLCALGGYEKSPAASDASDTEAQA